MHVMQGSGGGEISRAKWDRVMSSLREKKRKKKKIVKFFFFGICSLHFFESALELLEL